MSAPPAIAVIIMNAAAVDEFRRSLPGMGHDFFDDVAPSTIFLAPVAMWRSDWEWAQRDGACVSRGVASAAGNLVLAEALTLKNAFARGLG